jgi:hypothetical protein
MNVEQSGGELLIPPLPSHPDTEHWPVRLTNAFNRLRKQSQTRGEVQIASWYWSQSLFVAARRYRPLLQVAGYQQIFSGILDPTYESDSFGLVVEAFPEVPNAAHRYSHPDARLQSYGRSIITEIPLGDYVFPVALRRSRTNLHRPPDPVGGTAACWAMSRCSSPLSQQGFLTAKHVTNGVLYSSIDLTNGKVGTVTDLAPDGIDAALIRPNDGMPNLGEIPTMHIENLVAAWTPAKLMGASGTRDTFITAISDTFGIFDSPFLPSRLTLAEGGVPGDSGALVIDGRKHACGLYMGEFRNPAGQVGGVAQHLYQVDRMMDLELKSG